VSEQPLQQQHHHHHHRHESPLRRFLRAYWFEILWLASVALGIFLIFERMRIRSTLIGWLNRVVTVVLHGAGHLDEHVSAFLARTTVSDAIGYVLILGALLAIFLRLRWRMMHSPALTVLRCPRCNSSIHRTHRRPIDRLICLFVPVRRYRCANGQCRWKGLRVGTGHGESRAPARSAS